VHTTAVVP